MANQMIALGVRGPEMPDLSRATSQLAQMSNMMMQQRAAQKEAEMAQQTMDIKARLAEPQFAEAEAKAQGELIKTAMDFNNFIRTAAAYAEGPEQATAIAQKIAGLPQFQSPVFQDAIATSMQNMPADPAQFGQWREGLLAQTLEADKQLEQHFMQITNGAQMWTATAPKYAGTGRAPQEVAGTRQNAPQDIQYLQTPQGIMPMPKKIPGGPVGAPAAGGGTAAAALATNPGALKDGAFARSQPGYTGASGAFATFETPEAGIAAQENLLRSAYVGKGINTISRIVDKYAPQGPENSAASVANYKAYIARRAGLDVDAVIATEQIPAVAAAMREFETGQRPGGGVKMGQVIPGTTKQPAASSKAYSAMQAAAAKYDDTIAVAQRLLDNPALDSIVGNVQGNLPEAALSMLSQDAANALSDYNQLATMAGFQELQAMRDASPTGGALGQVSDSENKMLQKSAFASSRAQDEKKFRQSVKDYITRLQKSRQRVLDAYQREFGSAPAVAPTASNAGTNKPTGSTGWGRAKVVGD